MTGEVTNMICTGMHYKVKSANFGRGRGYNINYNSKTWDISKYVIIPFFVAKASQNQNIR